MLTKTMQTKTTKIFTIAFLILLFSSVNAAVTETITVTASRTPVNVIDTGSAITILDKETIERSNVTSVADLLRSVPGLHVSQQGSRGAITQIRVRGAEANQVLVLIDGVEANDLSQGSEFNFAHLMASHIERIEIVRGPQSALWGSDALSGVINIITTDSQTKSGTKFDANAEVGSFDGQNAGLRMRHTSDNYSVQLSLGHVSSDGTNISRQGNETDGYENTTLQVSGRYSLDGRFTLAGNLRFTDSSTEFDSVDFFSTGLPIDAPNQTDSEQIYAKLSLDWDSFESRLQHKITLALTDTDNENDTGGTVNDVTRGTRRQIQYQGDLQVERQIISLIAEYEREEYAQRGFASPFGDPNKDLDVSSKGLAIEYRYEGDAWHVSVSARHDDNSDFDNANTYRLTGSWHTPIQNLRLFSSLGRAVKNPTFTERFGYFDTFIGNPNLEPENSDSWELGVRYSGSEGSLTSSLSYFEARLNNEINGFVFDTNTFNFTAENSAGRSDRHGVELDVNWLVSDSLTLYASYTYIDSTAEDALGVDVREVRRPKNTASLIANYQWRKANLNLMINYNGDQQDDFFPPFPPFLERVKLDSYTLINLSGSYPLTDKLQLTARLENLIDEDYEEVYGFSSPGFAAYAGLRLQW